MGAGSLAPGLGQPRASVALGLERVPWRWSQGQDEPLDLVASLRKVYRGVSYGVLFRVAQAVDRSQVPQGFDAGGAGATEGWAILPGGNERAAKLGERRLLVGLVGGGEASCI